MCYKIAYVIYEWYLIKEAEVKAEPGPVESTMTTKGRQWAKLSGDPKQLSGEGKT